MNRLEQISKVVDSILLMNLNSDEYSNAIQHLYGVSNLCTMICLKRNLDPEISAISGMLHDIYSYTTKITKYHNHNGSEQARVILKRSKLFSIKESKIIESAIYYHSNKLNVHNVYDEVLKDADVLHHYLYNTSYNVNRKEATRLTNILNEFNIKPNFDIKQDTIVIEKKIDINYSDKIADIAQELAIKKIEGIRENKDFMELIHYMPEQSAADELKNGWCAAFVYHCMQKAGVYLPIVIQGLHNRMVGVKPLYDWANLPENNFYYNKKSFIPKRGDIVLYNDIIPVEYKEKKEVPSYIREHIGIVLECSGVKLKVAEGNIDNCNIGGITQRTLNKNIDGYIRIPNDYKYEGWRYEYVGI